MIFPFRWKEALITPSALRYGLVKQALEQEGIPYQVKIVNNGSGARPQGSYWGQLGERPEIGMLYYLYVQKAHLERARYLAARIKG